MAFFAPIEKKNESWLQLKRHRDWSFHGVLARHPTTRFIGRPGHIGFGEIVTSEEIARIVTL